MSLFCVFIRKILSAVHTDMRLHVVLNTDTDRGREREAELIGKSADRGGACYGQGAASSPLPIFFRCLVSHFILPYWFPCFLSILLSISIRREKLPAYFYLNISNHTLERYKISIYFFQGSCFLFYSSILILSCIHSIPLSLLPPIRICMRARVCVC